MLFFCVGGDEQQSIIMQLLVQLWRIMVGYKYLNIATNPWLHLQPNLGWK